MYSIFVNDMSYALSKACMTVYADDTTVNVSASSLNQVNSMLQQELMSVSEWVMENRLKLNVSKTKCIVLGSKHSVRETQMLDISLQGQPIEQVKEVKLLGVTLDQTLSWSTHINKIVTKLSRSISIVRRNARYMSIETRKDVLQSLVLCYLDYCQLFGLVLLKKI